jgi:hypothetical protein
VPRGRALLLLLAWAALPAAAQLRLPQLPQLPQTSTRLPLPDPDATAAGTAGPLGPLQRLDLHARAIDELLRHRRQIDADPDGQPVVRGEVVAYSPAPAALAGARDAGFEVSRQYALSTLEAAVLVLRAPDGVGTAAAVERLRTLDPGGTYDYNHLYAGSGAEPPQVTAPGGAVTAPRAPAAEEAATAPRVAAAAPDAGRARVGLVDGGLDASHPALRAADVRRHGCGSAAIPTAHGTAVASLLVGRAPGFSGSAPAATLYAADVYCGAVTGGAVDALVEALEWMAQQQVPVVNISLVGPANATLARVVASLLSHGHVVVAAVGNDGPAAPPLYPASYPGVVGVTAVDGRDRVLPEAANGPQVTFAAPGADLAVAASGTEGYAPARGTSFAAPIVAGLLAAKGLRGDAAVVQLAREAIDLGPPGRDPTYGYGLVGSRVRVSPARLAAARPVMSRADAVVR